MLDILYITNIRRYSKVVNMHLTIRHIKGYIKSVSDKEYTKKRKKKKKERRLLSLDLLEGMENDRTLLANI